MPSSLFDLSGKTAFVSGASRGLGKGFALALARAGADLVISSRSGEGPLLETQTEIRAMGRQAWTVPLDVRNEESIRESTALAWERAGHIDILVNNAGCNVRKPALDVTWEDWNLVLETNLRGLFFLAQAHAALMIPRQYGRIINMGSVTCVAGYAGLAPYGASRGGVKQ
ncbi:MAG TPA: short-chain dehydrogenase, partial [Verrucomicrobiales bacterium]|nr:short-chain dehydrogenase [Verrucomicrobiales bacterium]